MTAQERRLWYDFLRQYPVRFQRQKAIDNYIVDFYCHAAKLAIEIDGGQHFSEESKQRDFKRDQTLKSFGLHTIRFANNDINQRFRAVCQYIDETVKDSLSQRR